MLPPHFCQFGAVPGCTITLTRMRIQQNPLVSVDFTDCKFDCKREATVGGQWFSETELTCTFCGKRDRHPFFGRHKPRSDVQLPHHA